jgi:hypothetical protein
MRALLALLLLTSVAQAGRNELSIGSHVTMLHSDSANAMTSDDLPGGQISYARALGISPLDGVGLWATGTFIGGEATGTMFQTMTTDIDRMTFAIGGRARYALRRWLDASARLDLGTSRAAVALRDDSGHSAADTAWGMYAHAGVGIEVLALSQHGYGAGLRLEFGYDVASPLSLVAKPESASDGSLQLPMQAAPLGTLDLGGPTFGATFTAQF